MRLTSPRATILAISLTLGLLPTEVAALSSRAFSPNDFNPSGCSSDVTRTTLSRGAAHATADASNDASNSRPRIKRKAPGAPLVDSSLLRYISKQKQTQYFKDDLSNTLYREQNGTGGQRRSTEMNPSDNPYLPDLTAAFESTSTSLQNDATTASSTTTNDIKEQLFSKAETSQADSPSLGDDASSSHMRQFNHHAIAQRLVALGADDEEAQMAGKTVQRYCLVRTARRRIRIFLKNRDNLWRSTGGASLASSSEISDTEIAVGSSSSLPGMIATDDAVTAYGFDDTLEVMQDYGLSGKDISVILTHTPSLAFMMPRKSDLEQTADTSSSDDNTGESLEETLERTLNGILMQTLGLRKYDARKVLRCCPGLLSVRGSRNAEQIMAMMTKLGVTENSVARDKASIPTLLSRAPSGMFRLVSFLCSSAVRMPVDQVGPLLRRKISRELMDAVIPLPASFVSVVNTADTDSGMACGEDPIAEAVLWRKTREERKGRIEEVYKNMTRTAFTLRDEIGTEDLGKVISAYPSVLLLDVDRQILPMARYLMDDLGILEGDLASVLQLFPQLLGMNIADMELVVGYLYSLGVEEDDLSSMIRAFPVLLTMKIQDMQLVVDYLRSIGVADVGAFVTRLPPVLGYSVEKELKPKWEFLKTVCMFAEFEIKKFPAYFSYPFERVIKTRYEYLSLKGISRQLVPVDSVLRYGDADFAVKVVRDDDDGKSFRAFCKTRRSQGTSSRGKKRNQNSKNPNSRRPLANFDDETP